MKALIATMLSVLLLVVFAPAASARDDVVRRQGSCSNRSVFELKGHPDGGRLELEYEIDTPRVGQQWRVRLFKDGVRIFRDVRTTQAPSGSLTVRKFTGDSAGTNVIRARGVNLTTGETCAGRITL